MWSLTGNGSISEIHSIVNSFGYSSNIGMENAELGMVKAKEARKIPETARFKRQTLQAFYTETSMMITQAKSRPFNLSDDIAPC